MDTLERKMTRGSDRDASCPDTGPLMSVDQRVRSDVRGPDLWLAAACGSLTLKELIGLKSHGERSSRRFDAPSTGTGDCGGQLASVGLAMRCIDRGALTSWSGRTSGTSGIKGAGRSHMFPKRGARLFYGVVRLHPA